MNPFTKAKLWSAILSCFVGVFATSASAQDMGDAQSALQTNNVLYRQTGRLVGEKTDLRIVDGLLTGHLQGGAYNVRIEADSAKGSAPLGPVDVRLTSVSGGYDVLGTWNGKPIHLIVTDTTIRGSAMRQLSTGSIGYASCHYDITLNAGGTAYSGTERCMGDQVPLQVQVQPTLSVAQPRDVIMLVAYLASPIAVQRL
jgi:hypothetical protein